SQIFLKDIQGLEIVRCVSDQSEDLQNKLDQKGRLTKYLKENEFDWKDANVYICGRNEMIKDVTDILKSKNISNIYKENYG
ncbi:hypothetical protein KC678_05560, partial [Candidatus Dojkabacteria bacterium]|nr:hypothetical protein [Candidatus Dojkabacteria bacterium]